MGKMTEFAKDFPKTFDAIEAGRTAGFHSGAQIYISRSGKTLADAGMGEALPDEKMTPDSIVMWFSAGKPVAAVAIAKLWESGKLDLDDPVVRFIPEFAAKGKEAITIRHALTHTAGVRWVEWSQSWEEMISRICNAPIEPRWVPGQNAGYHAFTTWYILGEIVRRIDPEHRSFEKFTEDEIFGPLAMPDSSFAVPIEKYRSYGNRIAPIRITNQSKGHPAFFDTEAGCSVCSPGGSARGPARELGRFYEMLLQRGQKLLTPQTTEALTARHRAGLLDQTFKHIIDWGLGFIINSAQYKQPTLPYAYGPHASLRTFGHGGNQSSIAFTDPENALVVALVFNGMPGESAHQRRMYNTLTGLYEDLGIRSKAE
jgi:CubicO group peptidase (beta-lactamase class C family)